MSGFDLREHDRYGEYAVTIEGVGDCVFEIDIHGFGEYFSLKKDGIELWYYDTGEHDFENDIETKDGFSFLVGYPYDRQVTIPWNELRKIGGEGT